jgi:uncharacterized protein involved in exopolysaccharide biosynthesis
MRIFATTTESASQQRAQPTPPGDGQPPRTRPESDQPASNGGPPLDGPGHASDEQSSRRLVEPPGGFVLAAIARNKLIVCASALLLALAGIAYGLTRARTFTSSATLQVGQVNPNSPGFYSYVASATALAGAFSRAITAEPVLSAVRQRVGVSPQEAVARLSAEPIPQSPVFRVIATGPTEAASVKLANVAANAIVSYESQVNNANPQAASLLHEYDAASLQLERAKAKLAEHEVAVRGRKHGPIAQGDFASDRAARDTAQARIKAISSAYTATVTSQAPRTGLVTFLAGATSASSDRKSKVEMYGFIGLLAGAVIGCGAAALRERRRTGSPRAGVGGEVPEPARI